MGLPDEGCHRVAGEDHRLLMLARAGIGPPLLQLMWALGGEETRKAIEAAHERAIAIVLA